MKKSEAIKAAIAKIEAARPDLLVFVSAHVDSECKLKFPESTFGIDYNAKYDAWISSEFLMKDHLKVALSVAIADEYLIATA